MVNEIGTQGANNREKATVKILDPNTSIRGFLILNPDQELNHFLKSVFLLFVLRAPQVSYP